MKLLNFGSCNIDYVYLLDHIVAPGETEATDSMHIYSGGKGLNQSIAAARAGAKVYHAGCIGEDGEFLAALLAEDGVDLSYLGRVKEKNGHAIIQVTGTGENSIFLYPGSNAAVTKADIDATLSHFEKGDILLLQNEISGVPYLIERAYEKGMQVMLNPSPINDVIFQIDFHKLAYLILNEIEAEMITGASDPYGALEKLRQDYPALSVILTLGKRGSIYQDAKEQIHQPSFVVEAKDTTAAGDTFTGYFVAELVRGAKVKDALSLASCASAIAVSRNGAAPSIPMRKEVLAMRPLLKERPGSIAAEMAVKTVESTVDAALATVTLKDIAAALGYSPVYTGALIKRLTGKSYKEYVLERRLCRAATLLRTTDMPVGEVIAAVGYENESYFRKRFVEKYGRKPLEYRKAK